MNNTLARQLSMLRRIPRLPRRISTTALLDALEREGYPTTLRTIQRDLNELSAVYPLIADDARPQGWSWHSDAPAIVIPDMNPNTALGLSMMETQLQSLLPTVALRQLMPWFQAGRRALKSAHASNRLLTERFRMISRSMPFRPPKVIPDHYDAITEAILAGRQLHICYRAQSTGRSKTYDVNPLGMVVVDVTAYLVCTIGRYDDPRTLPLHRMSSVVALEESARRPPGFDIDAYVKAGHFGVLMSDQQLNLVIRMRSKWAALIEETPVSPDQAVGPDREGWRVITASVTDTLQLRRWLHGYGADIEVLEPPKLRREFADDARNAAEQYQSDNKRR